MARPGHRFDAWRRRFVRNLLALLTALQVPGALVLGHALARFAGLSVAAAGAVSVMVCVALSAPVVWRLFHWTDHERAPRWRVALLELPSHLYLLHALLAAPLHLAAGLAWVAVRGPAPFYAASLCGLALAAWAVLLRRRITRTRRLELELAGLPSELEGYRVVHLSDVHVGPFTSGAFLERVARRAAALEPDLVVLTGDMITEGGGYLDELERWARTLRARDGVAACLGNHDYYGVGPDAVAEALRRAGVRVLRNERVALPTSRGATLQVAGVDDLASRRASLAAALAGAERDVPCLLLAHDPTHFDELRASMPPCLTLSGHTHHGQLALPFSGARANLARLRYRNAAGLARRGRHTLYVHAGVGTSGPPARLGTAPEVVLLTLRRAPTATSAA